MNNVFLGEEAGARNTTGNRNSAMGNYALNSNTEGYYNSAMGYYALGDNNEGSYNSAMGYYALSSNTTGNRNSAVGYGALLSNTTGNSNLAMGYDALRVNTTGNRNSAIGNYALHDNNEGYYNSAMGFYALYSNTTGYDNSAMGYAALSSNTIGFHNSAMGYTALGSNIEGNYNSAMGAYALYGNTTGFNNSALGRDALRGNSTGSYNVGVGAQANYWNHEGSGNTIIGFQAGKGISDHNKSGNVFLGYRAGFNETGSNKLYVANSEVNPPLIYGDFSTGSVGIGTTSPAAKLSVDGDVAVSGSIEVAVDVEVAGPLEVVGPVWVGTDIEVNGNAIFDNGNVGIGTPIPTERLEVTGSARIIGDLKVDGSYYDSSSDPGTSGQILSSTGTGTDWINQGSISDGDWIISGTDMYSSPSGNVGIGMPSPPAKLSVDGDVAISGPLEVAGGVSVDGTVGIGTEDVEYGANLQVANRINIMDHSTNNPNLYIGDSGSEYMHLGWNTLDNYAEFFTPNGYDIALMPTGNVGIGTTSPGAKLDVEVTSGGAATIGSSLNSATGNYAIATGYNTNASNNYSTAMGFGAASSGDSSTAMGRFTTASGGSSTAMGFGAASSGHSSTAMGRSTTASGDASTAMGQETTASGNYSTAIGEDIEAQGDYSVAIALNDQDGTVVSQANIMAIMGGNVGIGTTNPQSKLSVDGEITVAAMPIVISGLPLVRGPNGVIGIDGSSSRFKEDIRPVADHFNKILQAEPKTYRSKRSGAEDIGFIAEEFDSLGLNNLVRYRDGAPFGIKYNRVPLYLLQVVKEQHRRISELEELRAENDSLTQRVEALERVMQRFVQRKELGL